MAGEPVIFISRKTDGQQVFRAFYRDLEQTSEILERFQFYASALMQTQIQTLKQTSVRR